MRFEIWLLFLVSFTDRYSHVMEVKRHPCVDLYGHGLVEQKCSSDG